MSGYPAFEEYNLAVCNPARFFSDPEIRCRAPVLDRLGQPVVYAGRYAFTFRLARPGGAAPIAVRCFQQEIGALVERYRAIDDFLRRLDQPFFVGFAVTAPDAAAPRQGVLARGRWLPAMRMDWVEGDTLSTYAQRNCRDPAALQAARDGLLAYARLSEHAGFAHGDIHPDNIVVDAARRLRFVDYDGMFVPRLAALGGEVAGQADYQSPLRMRAPGLFGPWLDRFPLLVLDLTLAALQTRPDLLARRTPGEGLLLGQADFDAPDRSHLLAEIERLPGLAGPVRLFREACRRPLPDLPPLERMRMGAGPSRVLVRLRAPDLSRLLPRVGRPRLPRLLWSRPRWPRPRWPRALWPHPLRPRAHAIRASLAVLAIAAACLRPVAVTPPAEPALPGHAVAPPGGGPAPAAHPSPRASVLPRPATRTTGATPPRSVAVPPTGTAPERGRIVLQVEVGTDGRPRHALVRESTGQPGLAAAAWSTVHAWHLSSADRDARPAGTDVTVAVACERPPDAGRRWLCLAETVR